jgi:hypothetical protein
MPSIHHDLHHAKKSRQRLALTALLRRLAARRSGTSRNVLSGVSCDSGIGRGSVGGALAEGALQKLSERNLVIGGLFFFAFWLYVALPFFYTVPRFSQNDTSNKRSAEEGKNPGFWEKAADDPVAYFTLWLVGFTGVLAASTIGLWIVTWRASASQARDMKASIAASEKSADIARDAMVAGERAFVFTTGALAYWTFDPITKLYEWRFRPNWKNSGDTPTKNMTMHTECELRTTPLPPGFNFDYPTTEIGKALIPPNTGTAGGIAPRPSLPAISPQDILDVQAGNKILYFYGWAKYFDVFPETPQHITRFCWQLTPLGDSFAYDPKADPQSLTFPNLYHTEGNCADDECA